MSISFQAQVRAMVDYQRLRMENVAKVAIVELVDEVLQGAATPIDTGQFMANMRASLNAPDTTWTMDTDTDGVPTAMRIRAVVDELKLGDVFYLTNSAPYGPILEYGLYRLLKGFDRQTERTVNGYSTQAPQGMFRVSCAKWKGFVFDAIDKTMNLTEAASYNAPSLASRLTNTSIGRSAYIADYGRLHEPRILQNQINRSNK
ncbi:hypothetical protein [Chromobacterium subtsugae]|uniref:hypothetical protein n=1 Tax=Chromobacterium subtsugae TaxID=251747 RepID=UPI0007F93B06|nr:hypothetical protein [Chromobacterium subtsugae]OBU85490.1 hypothetical protein MY55_16055 [Chromobacterium subtsugae]